MASEREEVRRLTSECLALLERAEREEELRRLEILERLSQTMPEIREGHNL